MNLFFVFCMFLVVITLTDHSSAAKTRKCWFKKLTKDSNVGKNCSRRGKEKTCNVWCNGEFETPSADEYKCIVTASNPEGIWTPNFVPRCIKKDCKFKKLAKGKNVESNCSRIGDQKICSISCKGEFETPPADEYKCIVTAGNPDGIWTPDFVPRCIRNGESEETNQKKCNGDSSNGDSTKKPMTFIAHGSNCKSSYCGSSPAVVVNESYRSPNPSNEERAAALPLALFNENRKERIENGILRLRLDFVKK